MREAGRSPGGAVLVWGGMCALTWSLYALRRPLPAPPWWQPDLIPGWWRQHGPLLATFSLGRELLFWTGCYVMALGTAVLVARRPCCRLAGVLRRARLPGVKMLAGTVLGLTAAGAAWTTGAPGSAAVDDTSTSGPPSTAPPPVRGRTPVLRPAGRSSAPVLRLARPAPAPTWRVARRPIPTATAPAAVNHSPPSGTSAAGSRPVPDASPRRVPVQPPPGARPGAPGRGAPQRVVGRRRVRTWRVRPGDNLWTIATDSLAAAWGRPPDVREVAPYWWRVVQVNRRHLPNPSDPNLLFAGDVVTLPPPPPAPTGSG